MNTSIASKKNKGALGAGRFRLQDGNAGSNVGALAAGLKESRASEPEFRVRATCSSIVRENTQLPISQGLGGHTTPSSLGEDYCGVQFSGRKETKEKDGIGHEKQS